MSMLIWSLLVIALLLLTLYPFYALSTSRAYFSQMVEKATVATVSKSVSRMIHDADAVRTLVGGTAAMRAAGEKYLPKEPAESQAAYETRLKKSVLFNATEKTITDMVGRVFTKDLVLKEDVPTQIKEFAENIDLAGRHINIFARDVFYDAMQPGGGYIVIDMPPAQPGATLADEQRSGIRPYWTYVPVEQVLGWRSETINGKERLTQFRLMECVVEPDGEFGETHVEQIRVLEPGQWRTFRQNDKKEWVEVDRGSVTVNGGVLLNEIPVVPVYLNRTNFFQFKPPLRKLADLNIAHWQLDSDIQNITHVANVPVLFGAGFTEDDPITIGANSMVRANSIDAKLSYVEHSGSAIGMAEQRLTRLENQMQAMGLQMLVSEPQKTATGEVKADIDENSPLAAMVKGLQDALEGALIFTARFIGLDSGGSVEVNKPSGIQLGAATLQDLIAMRDKRLISEETFWAECMRRGVLPDDFDPEVEKDRLTSEAPELTAPNPMNLNDSKPGVDRFGWTGNEAEQLFGVKPGK